VAFVEGIGGGIWIVIIEIADGVSETGGVMELAIKRDSWMAPSSAGARISPESSVVVSGLVRHTKEQRDGTYFLKNINVGNSE
jgi:hypothetical protein